MTEADPVAPLMRRPAILAPVRRAAGRGVAELLVSFGTLGAPWTFLYRRPRMNEDPDKRREREFDTITFVLAGVLSAVVLGAVGYGIVKSSRGTANLPPLTAGSQVPGPPERPVSTTGSR